MSGIITGPHFLGFFNMPGPVELGTMVAVLEVGAFSTSNDSISIEDGLKLSTQSD